jgi:RNA polymerase sigma factor (sigma-70 family)
LDFWINTLFSTIKTDRFAVIETNAAKYMIAISISAPEFPAPFIGFGIAEEDLIKGVRGRCGHKFKVLYKMYAPALMGIISRIVKSDVVAEDVMQETFVKIWNSIDGYEPSRGRLFTWLAATARHTAIDQLRSRAQLNSDKNSDIEDFSLEVEGKYQEFFNPDTIGIRQLTINLPASEKEILDLIYFQGYTHSETAEKLDIPLGTVKTKLRRAIGSLRGYF